jgi:RTA1 like protein
MFLTPHHRPPPEISICTDLCPLAIGIATIAILIRCAFRVAELSGGFNGDLANDQVSFMILEGAMIIIASFFLTAAHPGPVLGVMWKAGGFQLRKGKPVEVVMSGETHTYEGHTQQEAAPRKEKA